MQGNTSGVQEVARELLGVREVAVLLGVSTRTVRRMDASGVLPQPVRFGRLVRWRRTELLEWIEKGAPSRRDWEARRRAKLG